MNAGKIMIFNGEQVQDSRIYIVIKRGSLQGVNSAKKMKHNFHFLGLRACNKRATGKNSDRKYVAVHPL
jgi:hypothetical protein